MAGLKTARWVLVGAGVVLLAVVAGLVGYARYRAQAYLTGLPGRLGVHITQESDNVTYSQSVKGRTIYTVRAAKQIQHTDGKYTLRDVGMVLYGAKGDRGDRIHGSEFEWDQKQGVMRAVGDVYLDLGGPAAGVAKAGGNPDARMIHVKTSGLVFREKEKSAATEEEVEFSTGEMTGRSTGASYDAGSGVVVLRAGVRMSGVRGGRPVLLTAGRAEMDRVGDVVRLETAKVVLGSEGEEQTGSAERALVHLTAEGAPKSVEAEGQVVLGEDGRGGARGTVRSQRLEVELNGVGQLTAAHFFGSGAGGVRFEEEGKGRQDRGQGADARIAFDAAGRARRAVMTGGAELEEQAGTSRRRLEAARVELALGGGGKEPVVVTGAVASGEARLRLVDVGQGKDKQGTTATVMKGDVLTARFAATGARGGAELVGMDGVGKTSVEQVEMGAKGVEVSKETSAGNSLKAEFRAGAEGRSELVRAEQRGGVTVAREVGCKTKGAPAEVERARGDLALYEKDVDRMTMTGAVEVSDATSALFADQVVANRATGETTALGAVRVSYAGGGGEPVHVVAARAVSHKGTGVTEFFAAMGSRAKMWQGGSQVEAPELDFDQGKKTIVARDEWGMDGAVRAVLVDTGKPDAGGKAGAKTGRGPVRVTSREMTYKDAAREVEFRGKVRVEQQDGTMRAEEATVYLAPAATPVAVGAGKAAAVTLGGRVDHMVGTGGVTIEQPQRKATGERLVYTAADQTFVLTGVKGAPPKMVDEVHGTTTGAALRFTSGEDRVEVSGTEVGSETRRVRSETKVK